jgi:hypothetical protein
LFSSTFTSPIMSSTKANHYVWLGYVKW